MPSFFRSDVDVKIVFDKSRSLTSEEKAQKKRLMIPFDQSVRRAGTKGNFFFARKNATVGGPILILEPQGPVDRGIFQGGITRFGEILNGTFECPKPGFLILYIKKNINEANKLKFGRDIRKAIKKATGMMTSGGEDRITIITPKDKERTAREAATEKKRLAAVVRERKEQQNAQRKLKREELKHRRAEKRAEKARQAAATSKSTAAQPDQPDKKLRTRRVRPKPRREKPAPEAKPKPKPVVTPQQVEARWEAADTCQEGWLESESRAHELEATTISISAQAVLHREEAAASLDALEKSTKHLHDLREALKRAGGRAKFDLQKEIVREEAKEAVLKVRTAKLNEIAIATEEKATQQSEALESAREEALAKQIEAAQARLAAAKTEQEAASGEGGNAEVSEATARELADAEHQLVLAQAEKDIVSALKRIDTALSGIDHDSASLEFKSTRVYIGALLWENKALKKSIEKLREAAQRIESPSDRIRIMATHWAHHPSIEWAESAVDMLVES
ncbi:MAG: hypothetical protein P8R54_07740 [Myxococcota bacterium]|nr:hypothetical protein [Myxococcota bacterium]